MNLLTEGLQRSTQVWHIGVTVLGMSDSLRLRALRCRCYTPVTCVTGGCYDPFD